MRFDRREFLSARVGVGLAALLLLPAVGCGGMPASVSGVVTVGGEPLNQGSVSFSPVGAGKMAVGTIQSDGSYELMTNRERGLEAGQYKVKVVSREMVEQKEGGPPLQGKYYAPKKYSSISTSGLEFTVNSGSNTIDLQLAKE